MDLIADENESPNIKAKLFKKKSHSCDFGNSNVKPSVESDSEDIKMKLEATEEFDTEGEFSERGDIKMKLEEISEEFDLKDEFSNDNDSDIDLQTEKPAKMSPMDETINWPQEDLTTLINQIELAIPDKDNLAYNTRVEKLNWDDVKFNEYSGADCKKTWTLIQKRVRRFRLLSEVVQDAKEWVSKPRTDHYRRKKRKNYPDMPKRPLSVYMLFYSKMKDEILAKNPDLDTPELTKQISQIYKNIAPEEREKYTNMAVSEKKIYEEKLEEFYRMHPEIPRPDEKPAEMKPKKPSTPFYLYCQDQLKTPSDLDNVAFKEECKKQWKSLLDKEKLVWINLALDNEAKYQDQLKVYIAHNPDFAPATLKPILNKEEKLLKERLAGKPVKPPTSAYALFSAMMLQSEEIKKVAAKERMKSVADEWKSSTDEEKKPFQDRWNELVKQYKEERAVYLESLPEYERQAELHKVPKRKIKAVEKSPDKKKKPNEDNEEIDFEKPFKAEPQQPPLSGFSLFHGTYKGSPPVKTAWKNLTKQEKDEYKQRVNKMKQKYIKEYEKFLKSLSKSELLTFSELKHKRNKIAAASGNDEQAEVSSDSYDSDSESE